MLIKFGCGGVDLSSLYPKVWFMIRAVHEVWQDEEPVITSTWEGVHLPWSCHYQKRALDFRRPRIPIDVAVDGLRQRLGNDFDVVIEADHIHIEWDPKER